MLDSSRIYQTEASYLLQHLAHILPSLEQMLVVYQENKPKQLGILEVNEENPAPTQLNPTVLFDYYLLERLYEGKRRIQWMRSDGLPWKKQKNQLGQQEVFGELENSVLLLRTQADKQGSSYLFLLFFNPDSTNFGPVRNDEVLNTSSKSILEQLIYRSISNAQLSYQEQQKQFALYQEYLSRLRDKTKYSASKYKQSDQSIGQMKLEFAHYTLGELSANLSSEVAFSAAAQEEIRSFEGGFKQMKTWIKDALEFAYFTDGNQKQMVLVIDDWHFKESDLNNIEEKEDSSSQIDQRYLKVFALLNRIEKAALKVASERKKLTSAAVGQAMEPPITAPAISDAFKKNQKKIIHLLEHYPDNWSLIRKEFKPLVNISTRSGAFLDHTKAS